MPMYKKLKKQNGEAFAQTIRNFHSGLLEIPDLDRIVRYAGRDARPLLLYLKSLLDIEDDSPEPEVQDPFLLLDQAGYDSFHADTLEKQNSIKHLFSSGELLCTFNDSSRYQDYYIVHAIKKAAGDIRRADFNGKEEREDAYGTSVISIQMRKTGGFIKINNRYNHKVTAPDNTFNSNPDNIIRGLSAALKTYFNVDFSTNGGLSDNFILMGGQIFKYHIEQNNFYYGDQAWAKDGVISTIDRSGGDALFGGFLFDNKEKELRKIDPAYQDSFAVNFNQFYGGNKALHVRNGNLMLGDDMLIGAEGSAMNTLHLPAFTSMSHYCLFRVPKLREIFAPALTSMGKGCLKYARSLTNFDAPLLTNKGKKCLLNSHRLTQELV